MRRSPLLDLSVPKPFNVFGWQSAATHLLALVTEIRRPFVLRRVRRAFARRTLDEIRKKRAT